MLSMERWLVVIPTNSKVDDRLFNIWFNGYPSMRHMVPVPIEEDQGYRGVVVKHRGRVKDIKQTESFDRLVIITTHDEVVGVPTGWKQIKVRADK